MHSHFIPAIDDGSDSIETSVTLIKGLVALGYKHIITTPHVMSDHYENSSEVILSGLKDVQNRLHTEGVNVTLHAAAEYYLDEYFLKLLDTQPLLTLWDNYVLVEMGFYAPPRGWEDYFFKMSLKGYQPILAHPERYPYFHKSYIEYSEIKEKGVLLQVNTLSLTGYYGESVKKTAFRLLDDKLVDFIGTDAHHLRHIETLKEQMKMPEVQKVLTNYRFKNTTIYQSI
ncbi:MAG: CpsB/CapC family capsule biosynthesis tyrosine phosphatase [Saprospiraceae bacterium]|nr:CpsB/CapC family capsule biosynthesis tyrosine phosphatase [Saprospiraceae bacterium]